MHEKFCVPIKVLYVLEMFKCVRVFPTLQREVSGRYLVNRVILCVRKFSLPYIASCLTDLPRTLEVESNCAKHGFAERKQPIQRQIRIRRRSACSHNLQDLSQLPRTKKNDYFCAQCTEVRQKVHYLTHPGYA